jgi:hypothetical protein
LTQEEYFKVQGFLHLLDGVEMHLDILKDKAKALKGADARQRPEWLLHIETLRRVQVQMLRTVTALLEGSEAVEAGRQERAAQLIGQAKEQGWAEALDLVAEAMGEQLRAARVQGPPAKARAKLPGRAG